jgi:transposase
MTSDVVGIDLAKLTFDATLLSSTGAQHYCSFPNSPAGFTQFGEWLLQHQVTQVHLCMEATNIYWERLANWAHARGHTVSVVNPARIKGYAIARMQRNKTDKLDSAVIASFCATQQPEAWEPISEAEQHLRALMRHRDDLLQTRLQQENRLRDTTDPVVRTSLETVLKVVNTQLEALERSLKEHLKGHAELNANVVLLSSVVGIGMLTAAKVLAEQPNLAQYKKAKAAAADTGVTPSVYESGTTVRRRTRMSKQGKASLRAALYWPAITAMRRCAGFKAFAERLAKRGKPKKVIIGAVMRKLMHVMYGVLKHRTPYDPAKAFGRSALST